MKDDSALQTQAGIGKRWGWLLLGVGLTIDRPEALSRRAPTLARSAGAAAREHGGDRRHRHGQGRHRVPHDECE